MVKARLKLVLLKDYGSFKKGQQGNFFRQQAEQMITDGTAKEVEEEQEEVTTTDVEEETGNPSAAAFNAPWRDMDTKEEVVLSKLDANHIKLNILLNVFAEELEKKGIEKKQISKIISHVAAIDDLNYSNLFKKIYDYTKENKIDISRHKLTAQVSKRTRDRYKKARQEEKENTVYTSLVLDDDEGIFAEQVFADGQNRFCVYDRKKDEIRYEKEILIGEITHLPIDDEEVHKGAILLPSEATEYGDDHKLDDDLKKFITKYLDIPDDVLQFAIWNIKRSWVFQKFHSLNYLKAMGDIGQGKTRFLDTLGLLHYKPIATSGAATSAPVFRIIDKWRGTLIMDEADFGNSDETQDIVKIINQGYERNKYVMRCDQKDAKIINFFEPFCPKILATRKPFIDKAVESRCITTIMRGTPRRDIPLSLDDEFDQTTQELRNKLLMWRFRNYHKIETKGNFNFDGLELEPRVRQVVSGLIPLFTHNKEQQEVFKKFVKKHQEQLIEERHDSFDGEIVGGIYGLLKKEITDISAAEIIMEANITNKEGKYVKPRSLTAPLRSLGFEKTIKKKIDGISKRCVPLDRKHLLDLFKRYGYKGDEGTVGTILMETSPTVPPKGKKGKKGTIVTGPPKNRPNRPTVPLGKAKNDTNYSKLSKEVYNATILPTVIEVFKKLEKKFKKPVSMEYLIAAADKKGIKEADVVKAVDELKKKGELFEPKKDHIKSI